MEAIFGYAIFTLMIAFGAWASMPSQRDRPWVVGLAVTLFWLFVLFH